MRLLIRDGALFADNFFLCYAEPGHGRSHLPLGHFEVTVSFSPDGGELPQIPGIGWVGFDRDRHDVILGSIRGRDALLPSRAHVCRLFCLVQQSEESGVSVTLEVMP